MVAISLCMIVKNEEANLEKCLNSIAGFLDEIIIVDTGSSDKTKEIALRFTDKVYDFQWVNDFSAARNYSISKASNEHILSLDSDEFTESINIQEIRRLIKDNPMKIGKILIVNEFIRKGNLYKSNERISRVFSKRYYKFEGMIHEQLVPIQDIERKTYHLPLTVHHSGYEGDLETRKKKTERNIALLKLAQEKNPEDPYILYQLGKSYFMEEDYISACECFGKALYIDLDPRLEYVQDMVESYGYSLINSEQYEAAMQLLNIYDEFADSADFIFLIALILMNNGKFQQAIEEFEKVTEKTEVKMEGVNGYLAFYNIGVIYECMGEKEKARTYYKKCGHYDIAEQRLSSI